MFVPWTNPHSITAKFYEHELVPPDQRDRQDAHKLDEREPHGTAEPAGSPTVAPAVTGASLSPFNGIGVFTAYDNHAAIGLNADWAAIQLDPEGGGAESIGSLKADGYKHVGGWQARADLDGVLTARTKGLDFYIGQAESEQEYENCLSLGKLAGLPHALIGNVGEWWDGERVAALGWELILEAYDNKQPGLYTRLDSKGYPVASYCYGTYDATTERLGKDIRDATPGEIAAELARGPFRVPLASYRLLYPGGNWSVYLGETLDDEDRGGMA
jgi:hypothetical protein